MNKLKIAIIGATGSAYKRTIPALAQSTICEVIAIQGRDLEKLKKTQEEYKIPSIYLDEVEMLSKAEYDLIYIATPPFLHQKNIENAVKTKKPLICEKPLTIDFEKGLIIKNALEGYNDNTFMIAHHLRHQDAIRDIKEYIENGKIGKILSVNIQWGFEMNLNAPSAEWKTNPSLGGKGTFSDNGIHIVDLMVYLFGTPKAVFGKIDKIRTKETFDNETSFVEYENFSVMLQSSQSMKFAGNNINIYGSLGSIEAFNAVGEKSIQNVSFKSSEDSYLKTYEPTNLYANEVENFCRKLINNEYKNVGTTLSEGLLSLNIIDKTRESTEKQKPINL